MALTMSFVTGAQAVTCPVVRSNAAKLPRGTPPARQKSPPAHTLAPEPATARPWRVTPVSHRRAARAGGGPPRASPPGAPAPRRAGGGVARGEIRGPLPADGGEVTRGVD